MDSEELWKMEESFWLEGPAFYERSMALNAQMVFPAPVGILKGSKIVDGLRQAPRWESVEFDGKSEAELGSTVVLAYEATGQRNGQEPYAALCTSTYVRHDNEWFLLAHQQTPKT